MKIAGFIIISGLLSTACVASENLARLQQAYPDHIQSVSDEALIWQDGTRMAVQDGKVDKTQQEKLEQPALWDQVHHVYYQKGIPADPATFNPPDDPGRIRYEPFFRKMYGDTKEQVEAQLTMIYWMPAHFGTKYPLLVTTVNRVDEKLATISAELSELVNTHPDYLPFLDNPGGTFEWRVIANTNRLSPHSFGMTIDVNANLTNYWQWDLQKAGIPVTEEAELHYRNDLPWEIVAVFEKYGFIWGGKWHHYDSMHFEYRPEIM